MTSSCYLQTDGKNGLSHHLLLLQVCSFISKSDRAEWDENHPFFAFAANSPPIHNTTWRPFCLLRGWQPQTPSDVALTAAMSGDTCGEF